MKKIMIGIAMVAWLALGFTTSRPEYFLSESSVQSMKVETAFASSCAPDEPALSMQPGQDTPIHSWTAILFLASVVIGIVTFRRNACARSDHRLTRQFDSRQRWRRPSTNGLQGNANFPGQVSQPYVSLVRIVTLMPDLGYFERRKIDGPAQTNSSMYSKSSGMFLKPMGFHQFNWSLFL